MHGYGEPPVSPAPSGQLWEAQQDEGLVLSPANRQENAG